MKCFIIIEEIFKYVDERNEGCEVKGDCGNLDCCVIDLLLEYVFLNVVFLDFYLVVDVVGLVNGFIEVFEEVLKFVSEVNKIIGEKFV